MQLLCQNWHDIFSTDESVQFDPASSNSVYCIDTWKSFYELKYVPLANKLLTKPVTLNMFLDLRKHHRSRYKKSQRVKKAGWNHLSCSTCDKLLAGIRKESDELRKSSLRAELLRHQEHYVSIGLVDCAWQFVIWYLWCRSAISPSMKGTALKWGGASPKNLDCFGWVRTLMQLAASVFSAFLI